ncbi:hypothetical protein GN244_ATG08208 [Phytophthora infestans]|uniref:Uncharacterized protein n=1 Tax=Phytophthora infestans TaxID=4787 RepID=A0A833SW18_PHYIN|nr:hypothetical protein GN244_ATG08208 [Phytophthora infestans]KAF4147039.1 hypothetical protein GN958_ATG03759 [Phytophthora infestans]
MAAVMKGYADVVMIILVADNLVDLNTPTLHTKETIAPLALKNGHRDFKGEAVRAVRTEQSWPREVAREAASTQQVEATDKSSVAYRNSQRPAHRKRTAFIQRGAALQRAGKGHESSTRKKKRKSGEASATSAAAEMPNLIETLFLGAKTTSNNADVSLANTSATFARLRDLNILAEDKANDVLYACNVISQLREATAQPSDSSELGMGSVDSQKLTPHPLSTSCKSSFKLATLAPVRRELSELTELSSVNPL